MRNPFYVPRLFEESSLLVGLLLCAVLSFVPPSCHAWSSIQAQSTALSRTALQYLHQKDSNAGKDRPAYLPPCPPRQQRQRLFATSSSELSKRYRRIKRSSPKSNTEPDHESHKERRPSVVKRLARAAERAKVSQDQLRQQQRKQQRKLKGTKKNTDHHNTEEETDEEDSSSGIPEPKKVATLRKLTDVIDRRLAAANTSSSSRFTNLHHRDRTVDSMTAVIKHNEQQNLLNQNSKAATPSLSTTRVHRRHVAVVLAKPLQQDRLTVEYANRIRRLIRAMREEDYQPDVICFVGPQSPGNLLTDADAGYAYFQFLCAAHHISVHGIDIHLVKGRVDDGAIQQMVFFLQETCLPAWLRAAQTVDGVRNNTNKRTRLRVHFSLISSEYELCQLNDIHARSPGRSALHALEHMSRRNVESSWSYVYLTTVLPPENANPAQNFCAKTYQTAQELIPVLQNLRSVVQNREFFQIESYRVLVAARRKLVQDMESLYFVQPKLNAVHNYRGTSGDGRPVDVILEGALLSLGRCLDLVRPAGLLSGSVSNDEWKMALAVLESAIQAIVTVCDTDRPLDPYEWTDLGDDY